MQEFNLFCFSSLAIRRYVWVYTHPYTTHVCVFVQLKPCEEGFLKHLAIALATRTAKQV